MSTCVKNSDGIVVDPLHITNPIMTKFEYTRILGIRTKQLNSGAKPFVKVPEGIVDGYLIAEKELREKNYHLLLSAQFLMVVANIGILRILKLSFNFGLSKILN